MSEKEYEKLKKRFGLPSFHDMDGFFSISAIHEEEMSLEAVKKMVVEKISVYADFLGGILQPDTNSIADMHECKFFSEDDKAEVFRVYGKLASLLRYGLEVDLSADQKLVGEFICKSYDKISKYKEPIIGFIKKAREAWQNNDTTKEDIGYLG